MLGLFWFADYNTYRDEDVWHLFLIPLPSLAILASAPVGVPIGAVDDHNDKEDGIEPREGAPMKRG